MSYEQATQLPDMSHVRRVSYEQATPLIECIMNKTLLTMEQVTDKGKMARNVTLS